MDRKKKVSKWRKFWKTNIRVVDMVFVFVMCLILFGSILVSETVSKRCAVLEADVQAIAIVLEELSYENQLGMYWDKAVAVRIKQERYSQVVGDTVYHYSVEERSEEYCDTTRVLGKAWERLGWIARDIREMQTTYSCSTKIKVR